MSEMVRFGVSMNAESICGSNQTSRTGAHPRNAGAGKNGGGTICSPEMPSGIAWSGNFCK